MVTEKDIRDAYVHLRKTNQSIPDEVLDFIRDAALEKLAKLKSAYGAQSINRANYGLAAAIAGLSIPGVKIGTNLNMQIEDEYDKFLRNPKFKGVTVVFNPAPDSHFLKSCVQDEGTGFTSDIKPITRKDILDMASKYLGAVDFQRDDSKYIIHGLNLEKENLCFDFNNDKSTYRRSDGYYSRLNPKKKYWK